MALGVDYSSTAPQLIQSSGQALVQGIRQIGQQISGHLTEMQTKRDLGALAQETQGMNPESKDFPMQLTQLISRHPLAARDERGQMALLAMSKAHAGWQASERDTLAFQRQMERQAAVSTAAAERAAATNTARGEEIVNIGGRGVKRGSGEVVVEALPKSEGPFTLAPGGARYDAQGNVIAERAKPAPITTRFQEEQIASKHRQEVQKGIEAKIKNVRENIKRYRSTLDGLLKRETDLAGRSGAEGMVSQIITEKQTVGSLLEDLGKEEKRLVDEQEKLARIPGLSTAPNGVAPVVEDSPYPTEPQSVVPAPGAVMPAPANANERVPIIDPQGKRGFLPRKQVESALQYGYRLP